jgi:hypothetical protein
MDNNSVSLAQGAKAKRERVIEEGKMESTWKRPGSKVKSPASSLEEDGATTQASWWDESECATAE